jgi:CRISPR/Cas system CSM-associated protein Csm3 (group 7 of RAMP superfamily)
MGTGSGMGPALDAAVAKSDAGLPVIPGKTVKGLLREAVMLAEECGQIAAGMTVRLFGSQTNLEDRFSSEPGILSFTDATLGTAMESWAKTEEGKGLAADFYSQIASTAIDSNGLADEKTLRVSEVTIPLTLTSTVSTDAAHTSWLPILQTSAPLLREIGSHRHRGLGRVSISVREVQS